MCKFDNETNASYKEIYVALGRQISVFVVYEENLEIATKTHYSPPIDDWLIVDTARRKM